MLTNRKIYKRSYRRYKRKLRLNLLNEIIKKKYYYDKRPYRPRAAILINSKKLILNEFFLLGIPVFYTGDVFLNSNNILFYKIPSILELLN